MARFGFKADDLRLWALVTATVRPQHPGRGPDKAPKVDPQSPIKTETVTIADMPGSMTVALPAPVQPTPFKLGPSLQTVSGLKKSRAGDYPPDPIEPKRKRRLSRERDPIEARLDLHGLTAYAAEARLKAFVQQAYANDYRAVLVITGKGLSETGILKRHAPEWLSDPQLSHIVAGISQAHARHGGTGALYVALKRRS
ncbi:MAG: Smr/MutS family protein [Asticcacaulis sp.]